jgi:hypothetical protein
MRITLSAIVGATLLAMAPLPAFAHHKTNHNFPNAARVQQERAHHNPCNSVSNNPHQSGALQAMQARCRDRMAQSEVNPDDTALREACDNAARALAGRPC